MRSCRSELSDGVLPWLDAVYALSNEWRAFAPLLGTGANEGSMGYSSVFAQMLVALGFHEAHLADTAEPLLRQVLFDTPTRGLVLAPAGQFDPGRAGGFNQGPGVEHKDFPVNPWEVILTFEGGLLWSCGFSRSLSARLNGPTGSRGEDAFFASPFTVRARAVGYESSAAKDSEAARAEIWAPVWQRPLGLSELRSFIGEGRADVERRRATNAIEFAEAVASLGVDRGVSSFVRYSLLKRRGDSYVALPAGRFPVEGRTESDLVRQLDPLLQRLDRFLRRLGDKAPARYLSARRGIDAAVFALLRHGGAARVKATVGAIGEMERVLAHRNWGADRADGGSLRPLSGLSLDWVMAADDGSSEVRVASALASIGATGPVGTLRANMGPVDPDNPLRWANGRGQVAWTGNSLSQRLAAALRRRMLDASRLGCRSNPLWAALPLHSQDVAAFLAAELDDALIEDLLFGFSWVRWREGGKSAECLNGLRRRWMKQPRERALPREWMLLKLLFLPHPIPGPNGGEIEIRPEPGIIPLLCAGRVGDACALAQRRLGASGIRVVSSRFPDDLDGVRLAAALLLPVARVDELLRAVTIDTGESLPG